MRRRGTVAPAPGTDELVRVAQRVRVRGRLTRAARRVRVRMHVTVALATVVTGMVPASAEMRLPPGFRTQVYVTGEGFDVAAGREAPGMPSVSTLAFDAEGMLYLARTGRRYIGGEVEDVWPVYRIPPGGARVDPKGESRYFYGPPVPNPQVATLGSGRELFVTTFDRERKIGVLYRVIDGRAEMVAGGTPSGGEPALLRQPEGTAADAAGNLYVADRARDAVVRLDPAGRVRDRRWVAVPRPRLLAVDAQQYLWVASDGEAEAPWQRGPGSIWRVAPDGTASVVLRGPVAAGMAIGPGGTLFVADRQAARVFALRGDGHRVEFARFSDGDAPRALGFAPDTPATRRAGIAGDLFVVTISRGAWPVNQIVRVSGPFESFVPSAATGSSPTVAPPAATGSSPTPGTPSSPAAAPAGAASSGASR